MRRILIFPVISITYYLLNLIFVLPSAEHVLAFLTLLTIVFMVITHVTRRYDGVVEVELDPGGVKRVSFVISGDPETLLENKNEVRFKIEREDAQ